MCVTPVRKCRKVSNCRCTDRSKSPVLIGGYRLPEPGSRRASIFTLIAIVEQNGNPMMTDSCLQICCAVAYMSDDVTLLWSVIPPAPGKICLSGLYRCLAACFMYHASSLDPTSDVVFRVVVAVALWRTSMETCRYMLQYVDLRESYCHHLQDNWNSPTRLYGVIIRKPTVRNFTAVKTS
jgi:hypothetical protein